MIPINVDRISKRQDFVGKTGLYVTSMFRTIQGEGPFTGYPSVFLRLAGCNFGDKNDHCKFCFPADKKFLTASGKRKFKDVKVGDKLWALDEDGNLTTTVVQKVMTRDVTQDQIVNLDISIDGVVTRLTCTDEHPIHTSNRGFVAAKDLRASDRIVHVKPGEIASLKRRDHMSSNNPIFDPEVAARVLRTRAEKFAAGEYDFSRSEEQRANYRLSKLGDKNPMKRHDVRLKSALGHSYKQSSLEQRYEALFAQLGIKARYTGNTGFFIGDNTDGFKAPDFVLEGNKVIETYHTGMRYLTGKKAKKRTVKNYETPVRAFYEKFGYEVLFLTEKDHPAFGVGSGNSASLESLAAFKSRLTAFKRNGARLVAKSFGLKSSAGRYANEDGTVTVVNYSCAPYNTFIVDNIHTHNCDTSFEIDKATHYSLTDLRDKLLSLDGYNPKDVLVITGGEPTLQSQLIPFTNSVYGDFSEVQVETNGTQAYFFSELAEYPAHHLRPCFVVSPKASHKLHGYAALSPVVLGSADCLKFVVSADPNDPHHTIPQWALDFAKDGVVYVSPMAIYKKAYPGEVSSIWDDDLIDREKTAQNYAYAAQYAMKHNLHLSLQTHLFTAIP